jgi:hypothetical protein
MLKSPNEKADQTPSGAIRLPSSLALKDHIESRPGVSRRSSALIEAIRDAAVTDPSAGGEDRLRHLAGELRAAIERQAIKRFDGSAGMTVTGVTKGIDASDQYFLIKRDDAGDPVELLLEALLVSTAGVLDDILARGSTLTDLERCSLITPLTVVAGLIEEAVSPTS